MGAFRLLASSTKEAAMGRRLAFRAIELGSAAVFFGVAAHHVLSADFRPLVALTAPLLVVFYGFSSVLFVRGRALAAGPWQARSLYAAERAMQATVLYLLGILLGLIVYTFLKRAGVLSEAPWLLLFLAPYALMQGALLAFLRGLWALAPDLFRHAGMLAVVRRVRPS
jgi:hypothetical protein